MTISASWPAADGAGDGKATIGIRGDGGGEERTVMRMSRSVMGLVVCTSLAGVASARADAVVDWNAIASQYIGAATAGGRPLPATMLDFAAVHAAVYDAVQAIEGRFEPHYVVIPGASGSPAAATAKAAHDVLVARFPAQALALDAIDDSYLADHGLYEEDPGVAVGQQAAAGIGQACADVPPRRGKIAFVSARDGNPEIYSVNADGTCIVRLTNEPQNDDEPAWSPDGQRIAFVSDRSGADEIYVMNADGSNVVRRTFSGFSQGPAWSPGGTKIAYSTLSNGSANLWVVSPDAGGPTPTLLFEAPGWDAQPAWSPDGARLALVSDWNAYDFVYDIFLINADGSGFTALTGNIFDFIDYFRPSWSPSGERLAVDIADRTVINDYVTTLGVMNSDGSGLTPLIAAVTGTTNSWSPDGQRIAFTSDSGGGRNILWVQADGSAKGLIVKNGWNPSWRR